MDTLTKIVMLIKPLGWIMQINNTGVMKYELLITVKDCNEISDRMLDSLQGLVNESTMDIKITFDEVGASCNCNDGCERIPRVIEKEV